MAFIFACHTKYYFTSSTGVYLAISGAGGSLRLSSRHTEHADEASRAADDKTVKHGAASAGRYTQVKH